MMRFNKKKAMALSLALCMLAILSFSTLAWFNDSATVTNKFYVATAVGGDASKPDDIFSIDLWEHDDKDNDGVVDEGEKDQDGMTFPNIAPGFTYAKKPYVENTGGYNQWVRVLVSVTEAKAWQDILDDGYDLSTIFQGFNAAEWTRYEAPTYDASTDALTYVFYLNDVLEPGDTARLFDAVKFPPQLTQQDFAKVGKDFNIVIQTDAMQSKAIDADNAYDAFAYIQWDAGTAYDFEN